MDMKKILQAMDGVSTKPVEGASSMAKFLQLVKEADINQADAMARSASSLAAQPATAPAAAPTSTLSPEQLAYNQLRAQLDSADTLRGSSNTYTDASPEVAASTDAMRNKLAQMAAALKAKGIDAAAEYDAPDPAAPAAAPVDLNQKYNDTLSENNIKNFLSIIEKNDVSILNEGANPHKVSLPVQMAMQHYQQPAVKITPRESVIGKYFNQVEEEIIQEKVEKRQLINQYASIIAERVRLKESKINELSNEKLGQYKKAAGTQASAADKAGDYEKGNKRFKGIVKATIKQGENDAKQGVAEGSLKEFAPVSGPGGDNYEDDLHDILMTYIMRNEPGLINHFGKDEVDGVVANMVTMGTFASIDPNNKEDLADALDKIIDILNDDLPDPQGVVEGSTTFDPMKGIHALFALERQYKSGNMGSYQELMQKLLDHTAWTNAVGHNLTRLVPGFTVNDFWTLDNIVRDLSDGYGLPEWFRIINDGGWEDLIEKYKQYMSQRHGQTMNEQGVAEVNELPGKDKVGGATAMPAPSPALKRILMSHIDELREFVKYGELDPTGDLFFEVAEYFMNEIPIPVRQDPLRLERRIRNMIAPYAKFYTSTNLMNEQGVAEGVENLPDAVSLDVPLLIRLLEYAREDANTDMDLHNVAENIINLSTNGDTLTMMNYDSIIPSDDVEEPQLSERRKIKPKRKTDPCWSDYKQVGMKNKDGKQVPNCVPKR